MAPFESGRSAGVKIARVKTQNGHAFRLTWANGNTDLVFWRWNSQGEASFSGFTTNAQGAIIRRQGRKITYAGAIGGTYLRGNNVELSGSGLME